MLNKGYYYLDQHRLVLIGPQKIIRGFANFRAMLAQHWQGLQLSAQSLTTCQTHRSQCVWASQMLHIYSWMKSYLDCTHLLKTADMKQRDPRQGVQRLRTSPEPVWLSSKLFSVDLMFFQSIQYSLESTWHNMAQEYVEKQLSVNTRCHLDDN